MGDENIACPSCGYRFTPEDMNGHITYWGEDPAKDDECPECEIPLSIKEHVERTFEVVAKTEA